MVGFMGDGINDASALRAANPHDAFHHGVRNVATVFPDGLLAGLCATTTDVLADFDADAVRLLVSYPNDKSLAAAEEMDLARRSLSVRIDQR